MVKNKIIELLESEKKEISMQEIAIKLNMDNSNLSKCLKKLSLNGLINIRKVQDGKKGFKYVSLLDKKIPIINKEIPMVNNNTNGNTNNQVEGFNILNRIFRKAIGLNDQNIMTFLMENLSEKELEFLSGVE